jgi:hypothetical protein
MSQAINITTLSGVRLDVYPTATIEENMGGISLLSLADRTATYTNSFKLPRTPTNESVFAFASQPTRNNRPSIDVIITKGLFQRKAVLKVTEFDNDYSCSVSYDTENVIKILSETAIEGLIEDNKIISTTNNYLDALEKACVNTRNDGTLFYSVNYGHVIDYNNCSISALSFLTLFSSYSGIIFDGDLLTDIDFLKTHIFIKGWRIEYIQYPFPGKIIQVTNATPQTPASFCSDILKALCQMFFVDVSINNKTITLDLISNKINNIGIPLEGFEFNKKLYSGYSFTNDILYETQDPLLKDIGSDRIIAEGIGNKELFKIKSYIPNYYDTVDIFGYDVNSNTDKTIIMSLSDAITTKITLSGYTYSAVTSREASILSMSGFYSNILNSIFTDPIILEATRNIDPLISTQIMTNRVINSVQLGGRYWVDAMAYNLTTGQSKLTLIKLP